MLAVHSAFLFGYSLAEMSGFCGGNCLVYISSVCNMINATIANAFFVSESCAAAYRKYAILRATNV